jgi:hypothetical protein
MILYYYYLSKTASALEPRSGEVYSIQHYVIKFVSDLRQIGGFNPSTPVSSTYMYNTDRHDITEILLKVALNTINQIKPTMLYGISFYIHFTYLFVHSFI